MHAQNMSRSKPKKSLVTIQRGHLIPGFSFTLEFIHVQLMLFWRCLLTLNIILANIFLSSSCSKQDKIKAGADLVRTITSLMVISWLALSRGHVRTTTTTSRHMAAILQIIGWQRPAAWFTLHFFDIEHPC